MPYTPNNVAVFCAAFAGALAGMGVSGRVISDTSALDYTDLANVAGGYAIEFDTVWGANPADSYQVAAIQEESEATWQDRTPLNNDPAIYSNLVTALIASIGAGSTFLAGEGITPPIADQGIIQLTGDVLAGPGSGSQPTTIVKITGDGSSSVDVPATNFTWRENLDGPEWAIAPRTSDDPVTTMFFVAQQPFAGATGTNQSSGSAGFIIYPKAGVAGENGSFFVHCDSGGPLASTFEVIADHGVSGLSSGNAIKVGGDFLYLYVAGIKQTTIKDGLVSFVNPIAIGAIPSTTGAIRLENNTGRIKARRSDNAADLNLIFLDSIDEIDIGDFGASLTQILGSDVQIQSTGPFSVNVAFTEFVRVDPTPNMRIGTSASSYGGGTGVINIKNAIVVPAGNPNADGGLLYADGGGLFWKNPAGVVTPVAP